MITSFLVMLKVDLNRRHVSVASNIVFTNPTIDKSKVGEFPHSFVWFNAPHAESTEWILMRRVILGLKYDDKII